MAGEWDDLASVYADGCYNLLQQTIGTAPLESHPVILDFGCGTGLLTSKLQSLASRIIAIDVSPSMIEIVHDKIRDMEWTNVEAYTAVLSRLDDNQRNDKTVKEVITKMEGSVDIIVVSSVLTLIPSEDMNATMQVLGRLLKPNGLFFHTDWPLSDHEHPDGMTHEKALQLYDIAGMKEKSSGIIPMDTEEGTTVFFGLATKP
jgi:predicted TPR repeat methyltransferase